MRQNPGLRKECEEYEGVDSHLKFPPSENKLAGIPAFVQEFLNVSEAVPCPPFLHTSESGQGTIEQFPPMRVPQSPGTLP